MNANIAAPPGPAAAPRFDAKFIEENRLIERYLEHKLPPKGARELEHWCSANPGYLDGLKLAERAQASLQLLEAIGRPADLSEPTIPWWKTPYVLIALGIVTAATLAAFWALFARYSLLRSELDDARTRLQQGSLEQPATQTDLKVSPDRSPGIDRARVTVSRGAPQLVDLHVDMSYSKSVAFRMTVDKKDQGRALIVNNLLKDSNGELRLTFNTTGIAAGIYIARIESLSPRAGGAVAPEGYVLLEVR